MPIVPSPADFEGLERDLCNTNWKGTHSMALWNIFSRGCSCWCKLRWNETCNETDNMNRAGELNVSI